MWDPSYEGNDGLVLSFKLTSLKENGGNRVLVEGTDLKHFCM